MQVNKIQVNNYNNAQSFGNIILTPKAKKFIDIRSTNKTVKDIGSFIKEQLGKKPDIRIDVDEFVPYMDAPAVVPGLRASVVGYESTFRQVAWAPVEFIRKAIRLANPTKAS